MKWLVRIGLGLVVLVVAAVLILPLLVSKDDLVRKAEVEASRTLGREVSIGEVSGISVFPPRLTINELTVASGEGFETEHLIEVGEAKLGVRLIPLLSSRVEIERFVLTEPRIVLETLPDGTNNYTFAGSDGGETTDSGEAAEAPVVGEIEVQDGALLWIAPDGRYEASDVDLTLALRPLGEPMNLDGSMLLEGVPATIALEVAEPWAMTAARSSRLDFDIDLGGNSVAGAFDALAEPLTISGPMSIDVRDLATLEPLIGTELIEAARPLGTMQLEGTAEATAERLALSDASFATAIASGRGALTVALSGPKPALSGNVAASNVDLTPFFPEGTDGDEEAGAPFPAWSEAEMDFSGLKAANADLELAAERITLPTYVLTGVAARASLTDGRAELDLQRGEAFGGAASGRFAFDARSAVPEITGAMTFDGVDFAQAAPALLSTERLFGRGSIAFDMRTRGASEQAWVNALTGNASADIEEGRIAGVNLTTIAAAGIELVEDLRSGAGALPAVRTAMTGLISEAVAPGAETSFDVADFGVSVENGAVRIGEAKLLSDTLRATIGGGVSLPQQGLDLSIQLAAKAPAESGYREFRLPVAVGGSFSDPRIALDTEPLARELVRGAGADALGRAGIEVGEDQSLEEAVRERARSELRNLLSGSRGRSEPAPESETEAETAGEAAGDAPAEDETADEPRR